jgi:hypothetical protein
MSGVELFIGGVAALAVMSVIVKARSSVKSARAAAEIARVGTSPVSLIGRVVITALVIVGVQWLVITHSDNMLLWWVVLGFPALITAYAVTKALTVTQISSSQRRGGGW